MMMGLLSPKVQNLHTPRRLIFEKLGKSLPTIETRIPVSGDALNDILQSIAAPGNTTEWEWSRVAKAPDEGVQVWDQLARWKTWNEVLKTYRAEKEIDDRLAVLAAKYQLVTPSSGAVVLERAEQYQRFGLKQADKNTPSIPTGVPEPSAVFVTVLLMLIVCIHLYNRRRKGRDPSMKRPGRIQVYLKGASIP